MPNPPLTVLLVDDHSLVRRGFRRLLEEDSGIRVVGESSDGHEAVAEATRLQPNVVVMDFALPSMNGAVATRLILKACPSTAVLMLSMHSDATFVRTCLEAGTSGQACGGQRVRARSAPGFAGHATGTAAGVDHAGTRSAPAHRQRAVQ